MQLTILAISLVLMLVVASFFVAAIRASRDNTPAANPDARRTRLIMGMIALGVIVTTGSLWHWPHAVSAAGSVTTVNATGAQWSWEIDKEEVPLGKTILFNVHTKDVTHGLGVTDADGRLLFQTQAMPGYVNRVEHVFEKAGTYKIICMEFCGIAHHAMTTEFTVVGK